MSRTTVLAVQGILASHYDSTISLTPFLETAGALTDWVARKDSDSELNALLLERIECYLSAHFYLLADQALQAKTTSGAGGTFQGQTGMVFSGTQYGQHAMVLDVTGSLAKREKEVLEGSRHKVGLVWVGLPPSEQTDAEDRD